MISAYGPENCYFVSFTISLPVTSSRLPGRAVWSRDSRTRLCGRALLDTRSFLTAGGAEIRHVCVNGVVGLGC